MCEATEQFFNALPAQESAIRAFSSSLIRGTPGFLGQEVCCGACPLAGSKEEKNDAK